VTQESLFGIFDLNHVSRVNIVNHILLYIQ